MSGTVWLLGDIGGTNARFALADEAGIGEITKLQVEDFPDPVAAIRSFLAAAALARPPERAALAVAGPVRDGSAALTNGPGRFECEQRRHDLRLVSVNLVNEFEAIAWSWPQLEPGDLLPLGGGAVRAGAPLAVIGPGTGLGVAGYLPASEGWRPRVLVTQGGHVTMAAATPREAEIIALLRGRFGHVSAERVISGEGLVNLHGAIAELDGQPVPERTSAEVLAAAESGSCPVSIEAFATFCAMLGTVAANLALSLGAEGGVYLGGGILPRAPQKLAASGFRRRFEEKGRFSDYLAAIPTWLITRPSPAFPGLWNLARQD